MDRVLGVTKRFLKVRDGVVGEGEKVKHLLQRFRAKKREGMPC